HVRLRADKYKMARHLTTSRVERASGNIVMRFARLNDRLFANHTIAIDSVQTAPCIRNAPVTGHQLHRTFSLILDPDMIGPEPAKSVYVGLFRQKRDRNPHGHAVGSF